MTIAMAPAREDTGGHGQVLLAVSGCLCSSDGFSCCLPPLLTLAQEAAGCPEEQDLVEEKRHQLPVAPCLPLVNTSEKNCFELTGTTCPKNPLKVLGWDELDHSQHLGPQSQQCLPGESCPVAFTRQQHHHEARDQHEHGSHCPLRIPWCCGPPLAPGLFKNQLRRQTNFLHKPLDSSCQAEAVYCNVAPWKEEDFTIYANMPQFDCPRRTRKTPDQVEYASIVFR
ncbi:PREDICTED: uncharacterized protein LOC102007853 [Chinchilla lanigera]|uniref:uncharacterized protein LOC102007853 n=1 Tax=Chinchilla lanigera TaxID=34839 RepID=UPI00038ED632|nr:PREDICTED: uncharacterized protein LOC102007853 [Chinchilla lanigera]